MKLRLFGTLLLIILAGTNTAWSSPNDKLLVKADAPECQDKGEVLFCDYKSGNQKPVYLEKLNNTDVVKVFIYSALDLHVSDDACVDVLIHNAKGATVSKSTSKECKRKTALSATKSEFKTIETRLGTISLDDCRVDKLILDSELIDLTIKKTDIDVLDVSDHSESGAKATIQDAKINTLERLIINYGSNWIIQTSQIGKLSPRGLKIVDGTLTITDSSIKDITEDSLMLKDFQGSVTLTGFSGNETDSQGSNVFLVLFYVCLILLFMSWIIFIVYLNKERIFSSLGKSNAKDIGHKSNIESGATSRREQMNNDANTVAVKNKEIEESEENRKLLENKGDTHDQQKRKNLSTKNLDVPNEKQMRGDRQGTYSPNNISNKNMKDHLQKLQEQLFVLKAKLKALEPGTQNLTKPLVPYTEGQRNDSPDVFYNLLKGLLDTANGQYTTLVDLSLEESNVSMLAEATKVLAAHKPNSYFAAVCAVWENIFKQDNSPPINLKLAHNIVTEHEDKVNESLKQIKLPVKKSDLEKEAKGYEIRKGIPKGQTKYYCIPDKLMDSFVDAISIIRMNCLQQFSILINESIQQKAKFLFFVLNVQIALTRVRIEEVE